MEQESNSKITDHSIVWKYIASSVMIASTTAMILLVGYFVYSNSKENSPTVSLEMYDRYKRYSTEYADQLYNRVGSVTDVLVNYQRETNNRLDQHERLLEVLQMQLAVQKSTVITNNNTQGNNNNNK